MVYLRSAGICGQSDLVEVVNGKVNIIDYKTNKEIKKESYVDWEGKSAKMMSPVDSLDDCHFYHYALQLSIYMYIILKHNPKLKPGKIFIHHVVFEVEGEDQWGYPISKKNENGEPIVKEVTPILMPYLSEEVISIIHYLNDNKDKIKKKH
jgi:NADPH-dependent 7-cyano-7-deazaguanine reductase QueF-like protein